MSHGERLSKHGFHFPENPVDELKSLPFCVNHFRIRFQGWNIFRPLDFARIAVLRARLDRGRFTFALDHQSGVQDDAREPGSERRSALKTPQVEIPGKKGILDSVFSVFFIAKDSAGYRNEFRARRHEHLFESFSSYHHRSSFDDVVGLRAWRLAGRGPYGPFSRSKNGQGLTDCWRIGAVDKTLGSRCVAHWRSPFLSHSRSKCVSKAGFAKQSAMLIVFNGKERLRSLSKNPIGRYHGRDLTVTSGW